MKKKLFLKFFVLAVIGAFVTFTSCKDYDDDISKLNTELGALKADLVKKSDLTALQTELNGKITALQTELTALKGTAITQAKLDEAMAKVVKLETYNAWKTIVDADLLKLKADVAKAATKEELTAIETALRSEITAAKNELNAKIANLNAILGIADGKSTVIEGLKDQLAAQLALIQANRTEVAAVKADLEATKIDLANYKQVVNQRLSALEHLILDVYADLDHRVYTLTFIPDYTSFDGTPQIVVRGVTEWQFHKPATESASNDWYSPDFDSNWDENWAVMEKGKIYKGVTILRYNVSPSNVKLTDFQIKQLVHKTSLVRYADTESAPIALTGQATLANGVLSVPVVVEAIDYDMTTFGNGGPVRASNGVWQNVSVALQVENINVAMDNNEDRIVTSTEYIKCNFDLSEGRIALNEKSLKTDGTLLPVGFNDTDIASASYASDISLWNGKSQSGSTADVLNHTINLNDYIYGMFDEYTDWEKMNEFGFNAHTFKFRRVYLQTEGVNQSNDYVTLNPTTGVIGVVPANGQVNAAAVGRTPVVEVTALVNGKVHAVGYIKIHITDAFDKSDIKFEFTLEDYVLGCDSEYELTNVDIDAIDFDQVFNHARIQLGKDAFFAEYKQNPMIVAKVNPTPATATVGYNDPTKHVSFSYNINPVTQSVNLYNYLKGDIRNDAPAGTYKVTTTLKSNGFRPDVVITWNFKVVLPTNLKLTPNPVFLSNGVYKVEPTVYGQTPTPKSSTPYEGLLHNAYIHSNLDLDFGVLDGTQNCDGYLTPYFIVTKAPAGFHINTTGTQYGTAYEVRENGTNAVAATIQEVDAGDPNPMNKFIVGGFYIKLNNDDYAAGTQIGNFKPLTAAAQRLVDEGLTIDVQPRGYLNGQVLNHVALHDAFTVKFTKPIRFNFAASYQVWDQGVGAKQQVEIYLEKTVRTTTPTTTYYPAVLKDFLGNDLYFGTLSTTAERGLVDHYEIARDGSYVASINFDFINVNTDLPGGGLPTGMRVKASNASLGTAPNYTKLVIQWENASGGSVQNPFNIYVPVSVNHKWGVEETILTIKVNPGTGI